MHGVALLTLDDVLERCERVLSASPADATTLVWLEIGRAEAEAGRRRGGDAPPPARERSVLVRVEERGRVGFHRTGAESVGELENALRCALGQAKSDPPAADSITPSHPQPLSLPQGGREAPLPARGDGFTGSESSGSSAPVASVGRGDGCGDASAAPAEQAAATVPPGSFDPELARLSPGDAAKILQRGLDKDERAALSWAQAHVVVADSVGLRRAAAVTAATLTVRAGHGPGAGRAAASARSLAALGAERVRDRARARRAGEAAAGEWRTDGGPTAVVLAPEAVVRLVELLNRHALSARTFRDGGSALAAALGRRLFDPALTLRDDGTDPAGLPFSFDLAGVAKRLLDLVAAGVVATPAVDAELAAARGLAPTPHSLAGDDSRAENLFLVPSQLDDGALAAAAAGDGLWIGWLDRVECFDPPTLRFRARARGVRRLVDGVPGPAVGDLVWEDSLLRLFAAVAGIGSHPVVLATDGGILGAVSAPAVAFPAAVGLRPAG